MTGGYFALNGIETFVTRSGYTGEDGYEISVHQDDAVALAHCWRMSRSSPLASARGTRCVSKQACASMATTSTPRPRRRSRPDLGDPEGAPPGGARAGGYPGAAVIEQQLAQGPSRKRVGLVSSERMPVREGCKLVDASGTEVGTVTSGTVGPTVGKPIALAYVARYVARGYRHRTLRSCATSARP